ncbi:MAG: ATP-dependent Clp protease ATP-binding subunit ClpX [Myxococcota bacterium]|nr:ATP-dependent Clp protease ATP-binding subunit ClpX [Myxococcota bacterium]
MTNRTFHLRCSFCGKEAIDVRKLITGPQVHICDECVALCNEILAQDGRVEDEEVEARAALKPKEIKDYLDEHIIGQDRAKKAIAVAVYNHYKRINADVGEDDVQLFKGNILMVGPTGCGKTAVAQALAKLLDVPFVVTDGTCLTEAGYVGEDVESIIKSLWIAADRDVDRASRGIIVIDEIDKIASRGDGGASTRDVGGEGVQQALLKMIESDSVTIYPDGARSRPHKELIQVDTTHVLFILCGAFVGLEKIVQQRQLPGAIGFGGSVSRGKQSKSEQYNDLIHGVTPEDLIRFGLIPEFMGRLPVLVTFDQLDEDALSEILWKPKNSLIKQYKRLFDYEKVSLRFTPDAMKAVVREAIARKSGARGLRAILEEIMLDIMYDLPDLEDVRECVITEGVVLNGERPELVLEKQSA